MFALKWLYPGLRVKRWFILAIVGVALLAAGLARYPLVESSSGILAISCIIGGSLFAVIGLTQTVSSIVSALIPGTNGRFIDTLYRRRFLEKGQQIVVVGGGTGLATMLRGLKRYSSNITAIVTVADDGGSSGILRRDMGVLPPGDIRNCLVALADTESLMSDLFRYRYREGGLKGHSFGNLFIATLTEVAGDFETAVKLSSSVLAVRGQVLPSTLSDVTLRAWLADGRCITGENAITDAGGRIERIELMPSEARPPSEALEAIRRAEVIVLGPGSLYTSVIPNLLVEEVAEAVRRSRALKIYVCNVMTQPGETVGYSVCDHVRAIERHSGSGLIDCVLVNTRDIGPALLQKYRDDGSEPVEDDSEGLASLGICCVKAELASLTEVVRHDPDRLAIEILGLLARHALTKARH